MTKIIVTIFLLTFSNITVGQANYELPKVISPSPQSQALTRYGDYPMASYTGLTDITIPLHTITGRKLSLPITMRFHASGRMANETNGILGMRWTLNCGGVVSRSVKGYPDEWARLTPFSVSQSFVPDFDILFSACQSGRHNATSSPYLPYFDTEFDIFNYVLPNGKSGRFILKNQNGVKVPMIIPYEKLKIEITNDQTENGFIQNITITDIDGIKYIFGKIDALSSNSVEVETDVILVEGLVSTHAPTAWYLTKIVSFDNSDEISLLYKTSSNYTTNTVEHGEIYDRSRNDDSWFFYLGAGTSDPYQQYLRAFLIPYYKFEDIYGVTNTISHNTPIPDIIKFVGGIASLNYSKPYSQYLLNDIVINNGIRTERKIKFHTSKHIGDDNICYLDSLSFFGRDLNLVREKYHFEYYDGEIDNSTEIRKDWWGYLNLGVNRLLPFRDNIPVLPFVQGGSDPIYVSVGSLSATPSREPNDNHKQIGMLKSIIYPTGGQTEFIYEGNKYDYVPYYQPGQNATTLNGPGLRIKEIISRSVNGENIHKFYKYGSYEDGRGYINELLRPGLLSRADLMVTEGNAFHYWNFFLPGNPPIIGSVNTTGYRTRDYCSDPYIGFDFAGSPIKYDVVTEYFMDDNNMPVQKTQSFYNWGDNEEISDFIVNDREEQILHQRKFYNPQNAWKSPKLTGKRYFDYKNGQFNLIKKEIFDYDRVHENNGIIDEALDMPTYLHTNLIYKVIQGDGVTIDNNLRYNVLKNYDMYNCSVYGYGFRSYATGSQLLHHTAVEHYTSSGIIKTEKYFEYDGNNCIKKEEVINSKKDTMLTTYSYPHDYPNISVYQQMVQGNILSSVVEQKTSLNSLPIKTVKTNYTNHSTNLFVPQSIEIKNGINSPEIVATFNKYDFNGNILELQKANDMKEVYVWAYAGKYPVAKILGSDYITVSNIINQGMLDSAHLYTVEQIKAELQKLRDYNYERLVLVTTYTYAPLIGMTSETVPDGRVIYYEYDNFGRLIIIKDNHGKIIKNFCYNYSGQQIDCKY